MEMINLINEAGHPSGDFSGYMNLRHNFDGLWQQLQDANQGAPRPPGFASGGRFTSGGYSRGWENVPAASTLLVVPMSTTTPTA